jgi:outer membrane protein TolC
MMPLTLCLLLGTAPQAPDSVLALPEAVRRALAVHPAPRSAAAAAAGAAAAVGEARSRWLPQVTSQASLFWFDEPMLVYPIHGFDSTQQGRIVFDEALVRGDVTLAFTVFEGGARGARVRSAQAEAAARDAEFEATEADLVSEVTRRYLEVVTARAVLEAQEEGMRALTAERSRVAALVAEGEVADVELLRVKAALAQAEADRSTAITAVDVAARGLARAIGVPALDPAALQSVTLADTLVPPRDALRAALLERNPWLVGAARSAESAHLGRRAAIAAWFPQVDVVGAALGYGGSTHAFTAELQAGVRVSYPLFVGGARSGAVARAGALATAADERYRLAILQAEDALDRALGAVHDAVARVAAAQSAVTHLADVARIELLALEAGAGTEAEYLRTEADARHARALLARAQAARVGARVDLARLTGDLSLAWLEGILETSL